MLMPQRTIDSLMQELDEAILKLDSMNTEEMNTHQRHSLRSVAQQAYYLWVFVEEERQRLNNERSSRNKALIMSITPVIKALNTLSDENISLTDRWYCIRKIRYQTAISDKILTYAKKIILTLCAAAAGFIIGAAMGATVTGGVATIPAAILASIKAAVAIWGNASAFKAAISPLFFAYVLGSRELAKKTTPPLEQEVNKMRKVLANQNRYDLTRNIEKNLEKLRLLYAERNSNNACISMLSAVSQRAKMLWNAPVHWYTLDSSSRRKKSMGLYHATDQVLNLLLTTYKDVAISPQQLLALEVSIDGQTMRFADVLKAQRHPWADCFFSPFHQTQTRSFQEAQTASQRFRIA